MVEELQWCWKFQICDLKLQSYSGWLISAYSHSVLLMKSLCRCIEKKLQWEWNSWRWHQQMLKCIRVEINVWFSIHSVLHNSWLIRDVKEHYAWYVIWRQFCNLKSATDHRKLWCGKECLLKLNTTLKLLHIFNKKIKVCHNYWI